MTHYSIPGLPLWSGSSWSSVSALYSLPPNFRKSPNFELSEGVSTKTRMKGDVIMVIKFHASMLRSEKDNAFSKQYMTAYEFKCILLFYKI